MNSWLPYRTIKHLPEQELFGPGHGLCAGCGAGIVVRLLTKVAGENTIIISSTGCVEVSTSMYPTTAWKIPWIHIAFENAAAVASGIRAAYKALLRKGVISKDVNVIALAGDGGTADIGMQALSGALERNDRITYVCYDNEAYMNTGIQRSGTTPYGAWSTTTPVSSTTIGQTTFKKDLIGIAIAHRVRYAATCSIAHLTDAANKIEKALSVDGATFLHFLQPCCTGWRFDPSLTVTIARLAVQTGLWPLFEYSDGEMRLTFPVSRRKPVEEYLKLQRRFRHLLNKPEEIAKIQGYADMLAEKYGLGPVVYP